jgi:hypothetical protein
MGTNFKEGYWFGLDRGAIYQQVILQLGFGIVKRFFYF